MLALIEAFWPALALLALAAMLLAGIGEPRRRRASREAEIGHDIGADGGDGGD